MGDLIHTLPAVTDAQKAIPGIRFDWVAEEGFAEIPLWHTAINKVFPIAIRRWRKNLKKSSVRQEVTSFVKEIKRHKYDYVIDAQGLIKSAVVGRFANGSYCGMDKQSCKESLASLLYTNKYSISKEAHAIERVRRLFSGILGYTYQSGVLDYGLLPSGFKESHQQKPYLVFLHGTSGDYKLWPVDQWVKLRNIALAKGYSIYLPWGNEQEKTRAEQIADNLESCHVLARMNLTDIAGVLANAAGVVGVDTGLAHLAAALSIPGVTIYVDTYPKLTGACGTRQICMSKTQQQSFTETAGLQSVYSETLSAEDIWQCLDKGLKQ